MQIELSTSLRLVVRSISCCPAYSLVGADFLPSPRSSVPLSLLSGRTGRILIDPSMSSSATGLSLWCLKVGGLGLSRPDLKGGVACHDNFARSRCGTDFGSDESCK